MQIAVFNLNLFRFHSQPRKRDRKHVMHTTCWCNLDTGSIFYFKVSGRYPPVAHTHVDLTNTWIDNSIGLSKKTFKSTNRNDLETPLETKCWHKPRPIPVGSILLGSKDTTQVMLSSSHKAQNSGRCILDSM